MSETPRSDELILAGELEYKAQRGVDPWDGELAQAAAAIRMLHARAEKAEAERDAALAKIAHYETLRPASEHDKKSRVIVWHRTTYANGTAEWVPQWLHNVVPHHQFWTPLPEVKETK